MGGGSIPFASHAPDAAGQAAAPFRSHELDGPLLSGDDTRSNGDAHSRREPGARRETDRLKKSWGIIWQDVWPLEFMTHIPSDARLNQLRSWLENVAGPYRLNVASLAPASADASFRRYFRLESDSAFG